MRQLLTATEAATVAGVSRQAVNSWLRDGLISGERVGRWWFVDPRALERFLRLRRDGTPGNEPGGLTDADHEGGGRAICARETAA